MLGYIVTAFTFIGTLIGAGFASGKEIAVFFGDAGIPSVIIAGMASGLLAYPFMRIGAVAGGDVVAGVFPEHGEYAALVLRFVNFLVLSTVMAAAEYLIYVTLGFHGGAILTGIAAVCSNAAGTKGLKIVNGILVPVIIILVIVLLTRKNFTPVTGKIKVLSPLLYSAMNVLSAGMVTAKISSGISRKGAFCVSALIAVIVSALLFMMRSVISGNESAEMPLYAVATGYGMGILGTAVIYSAIFTTAAGTVGLASKKDSSISPIVTVAAAFLVSAAGFTNLVKYTYPFIGAIGCAFVALAVIKLARKKIRQCPCNNS